MDSRLIDLSKAEILEAMYQSVRRMNEHIIQQNTDGVQAEQQLQINLRGNFRDLQKRQGIHSAF